jgi:hypothetical protein
MCGDNRYYTPEVVQELQDIETLHRLRQLFSSEGFRIVRNHLGLSDNMAVLNALVQNKAFSLELQCGKAGIVCHPKEFGQGGRNASFD